MTKATVPAITSKQIVDLISTSLASKWLVVPECKDGPSQFVRSHLRMDVWAFRLSWAHAATRAYEIKVSRADFMRDQKWPAYLELCNELYFVCPWKLITPEEMPAGVGLMWVSKTGGRLFTKRKAAHREIAEPTDVYRYVLMCRAHVCNEHPSPGPTLQDRRAWLRHRNERSEVGWQIGQVIKAEVIGRVGKLQADNDVLRHKQKMVDYAYEVLKARGIDIEQASAKYWVDQAISEALAVVPPDMDYRLRKLIKELTNVQGAFQRLHERAEQQTQEASADER